MSQLRIWERDGTLAVVDRVMGEAQEGKGGSLFIVGEAGLGKTTLLEHAATVGRGDFKVGIGRADAAESMLPFGIVDQALRSLGFRAPPPNGQGRRSGLRARASRHYATLQFLEALSTPALLLLDDLHWADDDSLSMLTFLCRRIAPLPIAVIGTLRPWPRHALAAVGPLLKDEEALIEDLAPLSEAGAAAMVRHLAGGAISASSAQRAAALAAGNPLLIEHAVSALRRGRALPDSGGDAAATEAKLLRAWFRGASPDEIQFVQAASVLGSRFRPTIATAMAGLGESKADRTLEGLVRGGLLRSEGPGWVRFAHPLLRHVIYDEIPHAVRGRWHTKAFRLLAAAGADPSESAEHAAGAGVLGDPQAVGILTEAGRTALRAGAIARARQRLQAAADMAGRRASPDLLLDLAEVLLETGDGRGAVARLEQLLGLPELDDHTRTTAQRMLGRAHFVRGEVEEAAKAFGQAVDSAVPNHQADAIRALLDQAFISWPTGGPALATPILQRARELASDLPGSLRTRVDAGWAFSAFVSGDTSSIGVIEEAVRGALVNPDSDTVDFAWSWGTLGIYGNMAKWTERFAEATRAYEVGMQTAERLSLPVAIAAVAVMHADTCLRTGQLGQALKLADCAMQHAELAPERAFWAAITHAYIAADMGQFGDCSEWLDRSKALANPAESWAGRVWLLHVEGVLAMHARQTAEACSRFDSLRELAIQLKILEPCVVPWHGDAIRAYLFAGRVNDALEIIASLEAMGEQLPCRLPRIVAMVARSAMTRDLEEARHLLDTAIDLAHQAGMRMVEARMRHRLGSLLRRSGEDVAARPFLGRAAELAAGCGADGLARKALQELHLAHGRLHRRDVDPDALTPAEERVRYLAALGVEPKKIATQLFVTKDTIDTHLQRVYRKLRINSQRELMQLERSSADVPAGNGAAQPLGK